MKTHLKKGDGIATGISIGAAIGVAMHQLAIGVGVAICAGLEAMRATRNAKKEQE